MISPFTPLYFEPFRSDGIESRYIQTFASTDQILLEVIDSDEPFTLLTEDEEIPLDPVEVPMGGSVLRFATLKGLSNGYYRVRMHGKTSNRFRVTDDPLELANTTLIQYSMKDNRQRTDCVFLIDNMRYFFDFRVPGGFKDSNWSFGVENEQFVTPDADIVELYAMESTQKKFTMGTQEGVPVWFGELLNRLLCCTYVYFDGVRYARKDSAVPEMSVQIDGLDSFVFNQSLQKVNNLNPIIEQSNQLNMRRDGESYLRIHPTNKNRII